MSETLYVSGNKNFKLKLLRTVSLQKNEHNPLGHVFFAPLAMGVLFSQLKKHGYTVSQDDLSIRLHYNHYNKINTKPCKYEFFFDEGRIKEYVKSGNDNGLEHEIERIIENVDIAGVGIFLLSIPENNLNSSNILFVMAFSKWIKKRSPAKIVVGGHATSILLLQDKKRYNIDGIIDYIIAEDGEEAIVDVIEKIIYNKSDTIRTIVIRKLSKKIIMPDFSGLPIDKYNLSFLDYHDFRSGMFLKDCFSPSSNMLILPVQFIKGCPNICAFCASSSGGIKSFLPAEEAVMGIKRLQHDFNPIGFFFLHDTINFSKSYVSKICDIICADGVKIRWSDCAQVNEIDELLISKMRQSGCIRLIFGMETASPALLKKVRKGIDLADLEKVLQLTSRYGIWTGVEVICGLPHETEEDINMTINFLLKNKKNIDRIYCNVFDLRDHSLMFLHPEEYGIENINDANIYSCSGESKDKFNISNFIRFSFDEKNGLKWEDKKEQMINSYWKVVNATHAIEFIPNYLEEHLLFFLYAKFQDKELVKEHYLEFAHCFNNGEKDLSMGI